MTMPPDFVALLWTIIVTLASVIVTLCLAFSKEWIVSGKTYRNLLRITEKVLSVAEPNARTLEQLSHYVHDDDERR